MGDAWEEEDVQRLRLMMLEEQVMNMGLGYFGRIARINRAVFPAFLPHSLTAVIAKYDISPFYAERLEIGAPKGRR
ncbi:hypothetical protein D3C71_1666710 [compost metagenome]